MVLCIDERKASGACVADPFVRAKEAWIGLIHSPSPGRVQAAGGIDPRRMFAGEVRVCQLQESVIAFVLSTFACRQIGNHG